VTPPRQQPCSVADARTRLGHASKFLEVAELVAGEDVLESRSVSAALAVLAGIAAADAACCAALGRRSRSQNHHDAESLLMQIVPDGKTAAAKLRSLITLKDTAHYGLIDVSSQKLTAALRQATQLLDWAQGVVRR
jgi:hypothetical protein